MTDVETRGARYDWPVLRPFLMHFRLPHMFRKLRSGNMGSSEYCTVGYFPNWSIYGRGYKPSHVPVQYLTHVLYAFANINPDDGSVVLSDTWADREIKYEGDEDAPGNQLFGNFHQCVDPVYTQANAGSSSSRNSTVNSSCCFQSAAGLTRPTLWR